jgi:hypothetical protein
MDVSLLATKQKTANNDVLCHSNGCAATKRESRTSMLSLLPHEPETDQSFTSER